MNLTLLDDVWLNSYPQSKTNGRERIIELGLDNKQVAKRIVEIYGFAKSENSK